MRHFLQLKDDKTEIFLKQETTIKVSFFIMYVQEFHLQMSAVEKK